MFRRVVVLLSIANLLICPLLCTGVFGCADRDVNSRKPICSCGMCEHSRQAPDEDLPPTDKPCDSCQCVCGGAVSVKNSGPEIALAALVWGAVKLVDNSRFPEFGTRSIHEFASGPPGSRSGRLLRLELASLLC